MRRPEITPEIILRSVQEATDTLVLGAGINVQSIMRSYRPGMNTFALAMEIGAAGYADRVTIKDVAALEGVIAAVNRAHTEALRRWATEHAPPPLPVGTLLNEGVIVDVCPHQVASYTVETPDGYRQFVPFEDAQPVRGRP